MKHPDASVLALHAGGDLGAFARWRMERHLAHCPQCCDEVASFEAVRELLPGLAGDNSLPWDEMAAEMTANIRLGLAAGECVRPHETVSHRFHLAFGFRAAVAAGALAALVITGIVVQRPRPQIGAVIDDNIALQTLADGIGGRDLRLMYPSKQVGQASAGAQGSVGGRFTDPDTGVMTVIQVDQ